jgi:hypothetical protein
LVSPKIFWLSGNLLPSQDGFCCMELVVNYCHAMVIIQQERQCKYTRNNDGTRSRNHCCRGKAISVIYSECVFVALVFQRAKGMCLLHCYPWPVCLCHSFPHYISTGTIFGEKNYWTKNMSFDFFTNFVPNISYFKKNSGSFYHKYL